MSRGEWFSGVIGFALGGFVVGFDFGAEWHVLAGLFLLGLFAWLQKRLTPEGG